MEIWGSAPKRVIAARLASEGPWASHAGGSSRSKMLSKRSAPRYRRVQAPATGRAGLSSPVIAACTRNGNWTEDICGQSSARSLPTPRCVCRSRLWSGRKGSPRINSSRNSKTISTRPLAERAFSFPCVIRRSTMSTSLNRHAAESASPADGYASRSIGWRTPDARVLSMGVCQAREDIFVNAIANGIDDVPYLRHFLFVQVKPVSLQGTFQVVPQPVPELFVVHRQCSQRAQRL